MVGRKEPLGLKGGSPKRSPTKRTRSILPKPRRLLAMRTTRAQNLRMLLVQHVARNRATKSPLEGTGSRTKTGKRRREGWGGLCNQTTKSRGSGDHGNRCGSTIVGRIRLRFLRGQEQPQPNTSTIICGLSRKWKNGEPSTGTPAKKRTVHGGTRPIITAILHVKEKGHQIRVLLDTGCSVALLNQQTVEKLGIKKKAHQQPHSIENYTGEKVKGAGQFYTEPMLLQHRKHYSKERFQISPMEPEIDAFLPFDWITTHPPQGAWTNQEIRFNSARCLDEPGNKVQQCPVPGQLHQVRNQ